MVHGRCVMSAERCMLPADTSKQYLLGVLLADKCSAQRWLAGKSAGNHDIFPPTSWSIFIKLRCENIYTKYNC